MVVVTKDSLVEAKRILRQHGIDAILLHSLAGVISEASDYSHRLPFNRNPTLIMHPNFFFADEVGLGAENGQVVNCYLLLKIR